MTEINFPCPHCGKHYSADPDLAGQETICHECGKEFVIPSGLLSFLRKTPTMPRHPWVIAWLIMGVLGALFSVDAWVAWSGTSEDGVLAQAALSLKGTFWMLWSVLSFWFAWVSGVLSALRDGPK